MSQEPGALTSLSPPSNQPPKPRRGGGLSVLAFLFSLISLLGTGFLFWERAQPQPVISPLVRDEAGGMKEALASVEEKIEAQKKAATQQDEALTALREQIAALGRQTQDAPKAQGLNAEGVEAVTGILRQRLADLESKTAESIKAISAQQQALAWGSATLAALDEIARRIREGLQVGPQLEAASVTLASVAGTAEPLEKIKAYTAGAPASDAFLAEGLRTLLPDFIAREKMNAASNPLEKVAAQLQKLVVVRPRHADGSAAQGVAGKIALLGRAVAEGDFPAALKMADELGSLAPRDFPAWQEALARRAGAEAAMASLRAKVRGHMQGEKEQMSEPAPEGKMEAP